MEYHSICSNPRRNTIIQNRGVWRTVVKNCAPGDHDPQPGGTNEEELVQKQTTNMSTSTSIIVIGILGFSLGLPVKDTYDPLDVYQSSRIVGGTDAPDGCAPHMVAIVSGELVKTLICGGALVTRRAVLTAAHCIEAMVSWTDGQLLSTVRGQIASNSLSTGYSVVRFSGHENHPEWDNWLIKNDVGLLHLAEELPKGAKAKPIELNFKWVGGGQRVHVTGWGRLSDDVIIVNPPKTGGDLKLWGVFPDRLQLLRVDTLSPEECEERVRQANEELGYSLPVHRAVELCTKHERGAGQGMCSGDSGSALVDGRGRAVAVVSWGWPCARGRPDVNARISGFKDWLRLALALVADGDGE